uniref:Peptidase M13 N-terminal domain-containing protein n=1 Tax=Strigamia maritima TaxID=126957 RepID=T1JFA4_STRMM
MGENTGHHKLVHKPGETDETDETEKIYLANDNNLADGDLPQTKQNETIREKIRRKFACLGLTWQGLVLLLVICIILLIFFIIIIVLAVKLALYQKHSSNICKTPDCLRTSANILEKMDENVDPCQDFYTFSCGMWNNAEKNSYGVTVSGRESRLGQHLREYRGRIRDLINTKAYSSNVSSLEWKMKNFYESCMNTESIDAASVHPIMRIIDQLYGWNVLANWVLSQWDNNEVLRKLHVEYGVNPFFRPVLVVDDKVAKIEIMPSGLGLPHKKYYFRNHYDRIVEAYKRLMHDTAVLLGATGPKAKAFADEVFYFEKRLAHVYPDDDYRSRLRFPQELTSVVELNSWSRQINWREYLNVAFPGFAILDTTMILANKTYLQEVSKLFSSTDHEVMNNYMIWTLVHHYAPYLSKSFQKVLDNFQNALTGSKQSKSRWEFCIEEVEKLFPIGIEALYVDNYISKSEIENVKKYFHEISGTFIERINGYDWMDEESKHATRSLLIILKSDFFHNIINGVTYQNILAVKWLKNQLNREWHMSYFSEQNIPFITLSRKNLVVPYYLIQEPIFDSRQFAALNFGALGWLIGRALIQGFENADIIHSIYDESTFLPNCDDEENKFDAVTTQDENMADIAGLTLAYYGFLNWVSHHAEYKLLPAITDFTNEQLFFISYGQSLCAELTPETLSNELDGAKFSPNQIRVNGVVLQMAEFSSAFDCSYSSEMNAHRKCNT